MSGAGKVVCVTGASGYIASWLVKLLLLRGYTVNATVRDPSDSKKVDHLVVLEGAKERLHLFKAELTEEGSFDASIKDCVGVFHTASPAFLQCDDHQAKEKLIDPAIKGTINVLNSCAKVPSVKRVVLTSSIAAMLLNERPITPDTLVDETWWSDPDFCLREKKWYAASKVLAEQAAWQFAKDKDIDLITICPGWTIGSLLQPTLNESCAPIYNLIGAKTYPDAAYGWVHVKDIANAHIQALEIQSASGRYALVERRVHFNDIIKILQEFYPNLQLPNKCVEFKPYLRSCKISRQKAESLEIDFIPFEIGLKETIECFKEKQWITY